MIRLYHAPLTRSVRILWLLEELGVPYEVEDVEFEPTSDTFFRQRTPFGKLPTLEDDEVVICESGAILEYLIDRYGEGRLAPEPGSPERGTYLQWIHFAESTAFAPLGVLAWLGVYRGEGGRYTELLADARNRAVQALAFVERALGEREYLVGDTFTGADVMMGFTLAAARRLGVLDESLPRLGRYLDRLLARPALKRALEHGPRTGGTSG